jgi:hypothetical protein
MWRGTCLAEGDIRSGGKGREPHLPPLMNGWRPRGQFPIGPNNYFILFFFLFCFVSFIFWKNYLQN